MEPGTDFFEYVNGGWIAENPIPKDQSAWGSFPIVQELVHSRQHELMKDTQDPYLSSSGRLENPQILFSVIFIVF